VGSLGESLVVYYCVDEYSLFDYVHGPSVAAADAKLTRTADVVFGACEELVDAKRALNPNTFLAPHGVAYDQFRAALDEGPLPDDVARLPQPIVGFYGTVANWVDLPLVARLAWRHPEWSIVLIGPVHTDTSIFQDLPNVHLLGPRKHEELPAYCRAFSVGLIPYVINERMRYVNPIKLREYLSAGLPVVSTAVPEVMRHESLCHVAHDADAFELAVEEALRTDSREARERRSLAMQGETWPRRVEAVTAIVSAAVAAKAKQASPEFGARTIVPRTVSEGAEA
jgi:glycosyltransferase involved in cell wall biosynthesis